MIMTRLPSGAISSAEKSPHFDGYSQVLGRALHLDRRLPSNIAGDILTFPEILVISGWWYTGIPTPLKNMTSSVGMIPNIWKNKKCSKPPTIYIYTLWDI
jgi:lipoprotein-anchoring transpeptidase ErfK/SrfK